MSVSWVVLGELLGVLYCVTRFLGFVDFVVYWVGFPGCLLFRFVGVLLVWLDVWIVAVVRLVLDC